MAGQINEKEMEEVELGSSSDTASGCKTGEVLQRRATDEVGQVDALYSVDGDINYKNMSWWHVGMLMIAETISLGILSLPLSVTKLGLIPGILSILVMGLLATYSGYVIGQFKLRHPAVHSMADAGMILFGSWGYHIFSWGALLSLVFIMAAHILTFSVAMNVLTNHGACTILWAAVGFLISVLLTLPRTLKNVSYFSIASFISITAAVFLVMISLGVTHSRGAGPTIPTPLDVSTPSAHAATGTEWHLFAPPSTAAFTPTFLALLNICIAFMGNVAFFGFISELREPRDFPKSLALLQSVSITFYIVVGCVIYTLAGSSVVSPALGVASPTVQKIAYGVAMPTIVVAGVINAHVACKQTYVQLWRWRGQPEVVSKKSTKAVASWVGVVVVEWIVALVLALAIPVFEQMLGLISALFGSWFTYGVCGFFWVSLNRERIFGVRSVSGEGTKKEVTEEMVAEEMEDTDPKGHPRSFWQRMNKRKLALLALNIFMVVLGASLCGLGLYTTVKDIITAEKGKPFTCDSNIPKALQQR